MNTEATTATEAAAVAAEVAQVAPEKAASTKAASRKKKVPRAKKGAKEARPGKVKAKAPAKKAKPAPNGPSTTARLGSKTTTILGMLTKGATLNDLTAATGWQAHYADFRIMPTCVGNPACGAGIAAMESA